MFTGEYHHSIDDKNRIKFPKALLKALKMRGSSGLVLTRGVNSCLSLQPLKDWLNMVRALQENMPSDMDKQAVSRYFGSGAIPCNIDELGRLLIPQPFKEYAHLKREVVIVGVFDRIEIWDKETWLHYCDLAFDSVQEMLEKMDRPKLPEFRLIRSGEKGN